MGRMDFVAVVGRNRDRPEQEEEIVVEGNNNLGGTQVEANQVEAMAEGKGTEETQAEETQVGAMAEGKGTEGKGTEETQVEETRHRRTRSAGERRRMPPGPGGM